MQASDHHPWPCLMASPRELVPVASPRSRGRVELMLEGLACEALALPSTPGPTLGGRRGGLRALQGGPGGSEGWDKLENLLGSCPHHAILWSQGRAHSWAWGTHRRCGCCNLPAEGEGKDGNFSRLPP